MQHHDEAGPNFGAVRLLSAGGAVLVAVLFFWLAGDPRDVSLIVDIQPAGATVELIEPVLPAAHSTKVASAGEAVFSGLPRGGVARVRARAPGYTAGAGRAELPLKKGSARVRIRLARARAVVNVYTTPSGALVYLDNRAAGQSPLQIVDVEPGAHVISARMAAYESAAQEIVVAADESQDVRLNLVAIPVPDALKAKKVEDDAPYPPGYGRIKMVSSHPTSFYVDDAPQGTGTVLLKNILAGPHKVLARAVKRGIATRRVEVVEGETVLVEFEFEDDLLARAKRATDPSTPDYWTIKGGQTRNRGMYGQAVKDLKKALEIDETFVEAHRQLAFTLPALKRWDEAIYHTERYLELNPHAHDKEFAEEMLQIYEQKRAEAEGRP